MDHEMSDAPVTAEWVLNVMNEILQSADLHRDQMTKFRDLITTILTSSNEDGLEILKLFVETIAHEHVSLVVSRQVISDFASRLTELPDDFAKTIAHFILEKLQPRVISFEEQVAAIRQYLANAYEREENWKEAATILVGIPLETGQKQYSTNYKLETYVKIARLYLEEGDAVEAEAYINRASLLQTESNDAHLQIYYKACYARVLDFRRKFIEAAQRYSELSFRPIVDEEERLTALRNVLICTILATPSQQRTRMLSTLFKDERCQQLPAFSVLEKMYLGRLIKRSDLTEFEAMLKPHQKVKTADGYTILERAVIEHNILSISKLYGNIRFSELAAWTEITEASAEKIAGQMLADGHLKGSIDQLEETVYFQTEDVLQEWDRLISSYCYEINNIIDLFRADDRIRPWINENADCQMF